MRAAEWWEHKLVPILAVFYGTSLMLGVAVGSLWRAALVVLLSLAPGAMFVSVINDVTDRDDDRAAGKVNRTEGRSRAFVAMLIALPVAAGLVFMWLWRDDRLLVAFYLAAWIAFSLYSIAPFRFKTRGILGVLCDASGAHLFPTLVAVLLAFREARRPPEAAWLIAVAVWAFCYGLRGILWHQLSDREHDRDAGVRTFAERHDPAVAIRLGTFVAFPLELAALGALLMQMRSLWPVAFLGVYAIVAFRKVRLWQMNAVIVDPRPRYFILMNEFYLAYFPLALLVASAMRHPRDAVAIAAHVALFPAGVLLALAQLPVLRPFQKR